MQEQYKYLEDCKIFLRVDEERTLFGLTGKYLQSAMYMFLLHALIGMILFLMWIVFLVPVLASFYYNLRRLKKMQKKHGKTGKEKAAYAKGQAKQIKYNHF